MVLFFNGIIVPVNIHDNSIPSRILSNVERFVGPIDRDIDVELGSVNVSDPDADRNRRR